MIYRYITICFLLIYTVIYAEKGSDNQDFLVQSLTPKYEGLIDHLQNIESSIDSLAARSKKKKKKKEPTIIKAYAVNREIRGQATVHVGYYTDSFIATFINDPSGAFPVGAQVASLLDTTPISYSTVWVNEVVNGISYVKHIHDNCYVYSTDVSQFVVPK
jgi:hypothetical protein